jgi:serine/threonine protein kinase
LARIESRVFDGPKIRVVIPSTILFVAFNVTENPFQISIADYDSCPEFGRWQQLIRLGLNVDFRRILKIDSEFGDLNDYLIDLSVFETGSMHDELSVILREKYPRCEDGLSVLVKSVNGLKSTESLRIEIEHLLNLFHPCILSPIGFIIGGESTISKELKIVRLYAEDKSLSEVLSINPVWWTSTAKAKAVVGIVLSLWFAHSLGLIHAHLNSKNILFDVDHRILITDFYPTDLRFGTNTLDPGVLSGERWSRDADIRGFALILFEIIGGNPSTLPGVINDQTSLPSGIPMFVSKLIVAGQSPESGLCQSFNEIFNILKKNDFRILSGVDSADVLAFVEWVESFE